MSKKIKSKENNIYKEKTKIKRKLLGGCYRRKKYLRLRLPPLRNPGETPSSLFPQNPWKRCADMAL